MGMGHNRGTPQSAHARPSRRWGSTLALAVLVAPSLSVAMTGCSNPQDHVVVVVRDRETKEPVQDAKIEFKAGYVLFPPTYRGTTDRYGVARMKVDLGYSWMTIGVEHGGRRQGRPIGDWGLIDAPTSFVPVIDGNPNAPKRFEFAVYRDPDFPPSAGWRRAVAEREAAKQRDLMPR